MSKVREAPIDAAAKIEFLMRHQVPRTVLGHKANRVSFASKLDLPPTTLRDQVRKRQLSPTVQARLAARLKFKLDWLEWSIGSDADFQERYLRDVPVGMSGSRRSDVRLARGTRPDADHSRVAGLAAIDIDGSQFGSDSVAIDLLVSCGTGKVLGSQLRIRTARIELKCSPAVLTRDSLQSWKGTDRDVTGSHGVVRLSFEAGTRGSPAWRITAIDAPTIGNVILDPSFASIEELTSGSEIEVRLCTWLGDLEDDDGPLEGQLDGGPRPTLSQQKRRIIACIRKGAFASDNNGYVVLAKHVLSIVEADK